MRVLHAPLSALALAAALAAGGASEALAPAAAPAPDTVRTDTARTRAPADTMRGGRTTSAAGGEVANLAGASAAPIVASLRTDAHAMALLHESNLGEIAAGQRAVREAGDADVRAFAQMMITDHAALDAQGTALGQKLGVTPELPDSTLPQLQQTELQALPGGRAPTAAPAASPPPMTAPSPATQRDSSLMPIPRGAGTDPGRRPAAGHDMSAMGGGGANAFDRAYLAQQVAAHARTLALVDAAIARGTQAELKTTLQTEVRPKVAAHLEQAQALQKKIGQ